MSKRARDMAFRHFNKGVGLIEKGLHEEALQTLEQAEDEAKEADSPKILIAVLQTLADLLLSHGRKEEALERYMEASGILEDEPEQMSLDQRANMFSNMALALEDTGNKEDARDKYEIAAENYRKLIDSDPEDRTHIYNAISTLNNMGALLAETERFQEAFSIFEEALRLHKGTDDRNSDHGTGTKEDAGHRQKRITILENLLSTPVENNTAVEEERYKSLLDAYLEEADDNRSSSKAPSFIQKYAIILESKGKKYEAFHELEKAIEYASLQSFGNHEDAFFRKTLVNILRAMSRILEDEETSPWLMEKYEVILEMSRRLLEFMPESTSYHLNVAFALDITGNILRDSGRTEEALVRIEEAADIALNLPGKDLNDISSMHAAISIVEDLITLAGMKENRDEKLELYGRLEKRIGPLGQESLEMGLICAGICNESGIILAENEKYEEALEYFKKALSTYETVKHATGDDSGMNDVLENEANTLYSLGRYEEALQNYIGLLRTGKSSEEYLRRIDEILLAKEKKADNTGDLEFLKKEYDNILSVRNEVSGLVPDNNGINAGRVRELQEKNADLFLATGQEKDALEIYEQLRENYGTDRYLSRISSLLEKLRISAENKDSAEKIENLEFLLLKYNEMIEKRGNDVTLLKNRADVIDSIAYALSEKGDNEGSEHMCEYALAAYTELAEMEPEDGFPLERIAALNARIAEIATETGNEEKARNRYEESLGIYRTLMQNDPSNTAYQLEHASVLDGIGSLFLRYNMYTEAKKSYEDALKTYVTIMELEPYNMRYRSNVNITLNNLGYALELMGRKDDAQWMYENARKIDKGAE